MVLIQKWCEDALQSFRALLGHQENHHLLVQVHIDIRDVVCRRVVCTLDRMCQPELFHPSPLHSLPPLSEEEEEASVVQ